MAGAGCLLLAILAGEAGLDQIRATMIVGAVGAIILAALLGGSRAGDADGGCGGGDCGGDGGGD